MKHLSTNSMTLPMTDNMKHLTLLLLCGLVSWSAAAQTEEGDLPGQNITVVSEIKPILAEARKQDFQPQLPEPEVSNEPITYDIPTRSLQIPFVSPDVRPLAMKPEEVEALGNVYAKVGFGNYSTPYLDLYVNSGRDKKYDNRDNLTNLGARVHYLSSQGALPDQQFSDLATKLFGQFYLGQQVRLDAFAGYNRNAVRFYGYDPVLDTLLAQADNQQNFNNFFGGVRFGNSDNTYFDIDYDGGFRIDYLTDRLGQTEINPLFDARMQKTFENDNALGANVAIDHTTYNPDTVNINRTIISLRPYFRLQKGSWLAHLGINVGANERGFYVFPDVQFERELIGKAIVFQADFSGRVVTNNYRSLSQENPFLAQGIEINNSNEWGVRVGLRGSPTTGLSYAVQLATTNIRYLPLFTTDPAAINRFQVVYDSNATVFNFHAEAGYSFGERLRLLASMDLFNYDLSNVADAWHLPTIRSGIGLQVNASDRFSAQAQIFLLNGMPVLNRMQVIETLPGVADINLGASYRINESFYVFADINNIAAARYQRYYQYPSLGLNAIGGIKMIF